MSFSVDTSGAQGAAGFVSGIAATVSTNQFIGNATKYVWSRLAAHFDMYLDGLAKADPSSFMHVYEYGNTVQESRDRIGDGDPKSRLWVQVLRGRDGNRVATFKFKASKKPVPVDPILLTPGPSGRSVTPGVHIFAMKATVMELGMPVEITPKLAKFLAFVAERQSAGAGSDLAPSGTNKDGSVRFSGGVAIEEAGGGHTTGKFTDAFLTWWSELAQAEFNSSIKPGLENDLREVAVEKEWGRIGKRTTSKNMAISARAAFIEGKAAAVEAVLAKEANYIAQAEARRAIALGGLEIDE